MITVKSISKKFLVNNSFLFPKYKTILENISFKIKNNKCFVGIIGGNGSGKSTLLSLLSGFTMANQGEILLKYHKNEFKNLELKKVSYFCHDKIFKDYNLNLQKNLLLLKKLFNLNFNYKKDLFLNFIKKSFNIDDAKFNISLSKFSKGMVQKFNLIKSLLIDPIINCYDEPLQGLDKESISKFIDILNIKKKIIKDQKKNRFFFFTSHNMFFLYSICDIFVYLDNGKLKKFFKRNEVYNNIEVFFIINNKKEMLNYKYLLEDKLLFFSLNNYSIFFKKHDNILLMCCYIRGLNNIFFYNTINELINYMLSIKLKIFKLEYSFIDLKKIK